MGFNNGLNETVTIVRLYSVKPEGNTLFIQKYEESMDLLIIIRREILIILFYYMYLFSYL